MSLSSALNLSLSGLSASSRMAATVSENVANSQTPGYSVRSVELAAGADAQGTPGTRIVGIKRAEAPLVSEMRREAQSAAAEQSALSEASRRLSDAVGQPGEPTGLAARLDSLDQALARLTATPESTTLQRAVVTELDLLSEKFADAAEAILTVKETADRTIASEVERLNSALSGLERLNATIRSREASGRDINTLLDQRSVLVDTVTTIVPVRIVEREGSQISLYTPQGATLLDARAAEITFAQSPVITADMTLENGQLGALIVNGQAVDMGSSRLGGGSLAAQFRIRDSLAAEAGNHLDALALHTASRLQQADTTLAQGAPGLLTDAGLLAEAANQTGLAARLEVNALVTPSGSDQIWRVRDGLGAAAPGLELDATGPTALLDAVRSAQSPPPGSVDDAPRSLTGHMSALGTALRTQSDAFEREASFRSAEALELEVEESDLLGVNTDAQLQQLLTIEAAFEANARVMTVVGRLLDELMEI